MPSVDRQKSKTKEKDSAQQKQRRQLSTSSTSSLSSSSSSSSSVASISSQSTAVIPHRSQYFLILVLAPVNGTFERKTLVLPFYPEVLKLGRQTSPKNAPAPDNGYFDSRVLSRSHAEVWADRDTGKVWIKDSKSSNGTYINSVRIGNEKSESEPHELKKNDTLELGIDITNDERTTFVHRKISALVERISMMSLQTQNEGPYGAFGDSLHGTSSNDGGGSTNNSYRPLSLTGIANGNGSLNNMQSGAGSLPSSLLANGGGSKAIGGPVAAESLDVTLFGEIDASLEDLSLSHTRHSVGGLFMKSGFVSSALLERIVKNLVSEIHHAKVESAKIRSVSKLLDEISTNQKESRLLTERLPSLDLYKQQLEIISRDLEQARQEIALKDGRIADLERLLAASKAASLSNNVESNSPSSILQDSISKSNEATDPNDLTKEISFPSAQHHTDSSSNFESVSSSSSSSPSSLKDYEKEYDDKRPFHRSDIEASSDIHSHKDDTNNKPSISKPARPQSPDLYSDPIHQLSSPPDISSLNLNSPSIGSSTSTSSSKHLQLRGAAGISSALAGDPVTHAVDSDGRQYSYDFDYDDEYDDFIKNGNGSLVPRRSSSVPSYSPPRSPRHSFGEMGSLPQSPRSFFHSSSGSRSVSGASGSPLIHNFEPQRSNALSPISSSINSSSGLLGIGSLKFNNHAKSLSSSRSIDSNLNAHVISSGSKSMNKSNSTNSTSNYNITTTTKNNPGSSSNNNNNSNNSNTNQSNNIKTNRNSTGGINSNTNDTESAIADSEDEEDTLARLQALSEELEETKCQLEMYKNRVETAEKLALDQSKRLGELALSSRARTDSFGSAHNDHLDVPSSNTSSSGNSSKHSAGLGINLGSSGSNSRFKSRSGSSSNNSASTSSSSSNNTKFSDSALSSTSNATATTKTTQVSSTLNSSDDIYEKKGESETTALSTTTPPSSSSSPSSVLNTQRNSEHSPSQKEHQKSLRDFLRHAQDHNIAALGFAVLGISIMAYFNSIRGEQ